MGPPSEAAPVAIARAFGQRYAEKPIIDDMRESGNLGKPGAHKLFVDTSTNDSDDNMIVWMGLHQNLPRSKVTAMLDYRHRRGAYANKPNGHWKRPDAVCDTPIAREFYEIKPMSDPGIIAANEKFRLIGEFTEEFDLPYVRGEKYMTDNERKEKELKIPSVLRPAIDRLLRMFGLRSVKVYVVWERPMPGMIVYCIKVVVERDDGRSARMRAMRNFAKYVLQLLIQAEVPEASLGVPQPRGVVTVDVPPELNFCKELLAATAGDMVEDVVPGETHLLVIEEEGFQQIIEKQRQMPLLLAQTGPMTNNALWHSAIMQGNAEAADRRDNLIILASAVMVGGVMAYAFAPALAAGAASTAYGSGAAGSAGTLTEGEAIRRTAQVGVKVVKQFKDVLRGAAANDNARKIANAALIPLVGGGIVLASARDAFAANMSLISTGDVPTNLLSFAPTWLLRPTWVSGPGPKNFGDTLDVSRFGLVRLDLSRTAKSLRTMRLIGRVTFS